MNAPPASLNMPPYAVPDSLLRPTRSILGLVAAAGLMVVLLFGSTEAKAQNVFTVNMDIDADAGQANGTCDVSPIQPGNQCTLREAIIEANGAANGSTPDRIEFNIPTTRSASDPHVLSVSSPLPEITETVEIDATTEPDYGGTLPVVELDGTNAGSSADGLVSQSDLSSTIGLIVKGLAIVNFAGDGIVLGDGGDLNRIEGCHIGMRADGLTAAGNGRGIFLGNAVPGADIDDNIISGNEREGIFLAARARITANTIGPDKDGNAIGNGSNDSQAGVRVNATGAFIFGNDISYNFGDGVEVIDLTGPNAENEIRGNSMRLNGGVAVDLEGGSEDGDGRTANDAGDGDDGANRLQNYPIIESTSLDTQAGTVTVTYYVDSDPNLSTSGASAYPLTVNVYRADGSGEEAYGIIGQTDYTATDYGQCGTPPCSVTETFSYSIALSETDFITATATDADGNTSEVSDPAKQLPVEFAGVDARTIDANRVAVTWTTLEETGNDGFYVERRTNGGAYVELGFEPGAGTTSQTLSYRFVDDDVPFDAETLTYRLRQVDVDGDVSYSPTASVSRAAAGLSVGKPSPNPVSTTFSVDVSIPDDTEGAELVLYDLLGRRVKTFPSATPTGRSTQTLSASGLASGTYVLRLESGSRTLTRRVTIVR